MGVTVPRMTDGEIFALVEEHDRRLTPGVKHEGGEPTGRRFRSAEAFGEAHGVNGKKIERCRAIIDYATEETKRDVRSNRISIYRGAELAREERDRALASAAAGPTSVGSYVEAVRDLAANRDGDACGRRASDALGEAASLGIFARLREMGDARALAAIESLKRSVSSLDESKILAPRRTQAAELADIVRSTIAKGLPPVGEAGPSAGESGPSTPQPPASQPDRVVLFEGIGDDGRRYRLVREVVPQPDIRANS